MYALSITYTIQENTPPPVVEENAYHYLVALENSDGPPPCKGTSIYTPTENGAQFVRYSRYSNTLAVLETISNEFQNPASNLYARHAWALENNLGIAYSITEVTEPVDPVQENLIPDFTFESIPE